MINVLLFFFFVRSYKLREKEKPQGEISFVSVSGPLKIISPQGKRVFIPSLLSPFSVLSALFCLSPLWNGKTGTLPDSLIFGLQVISFSFQFD